VHGLRKNIEDKIMNTWHFVENTTHYAACLKIPVNFLLD